MERNLRTDERSRAEIPLDPPSRGDVTARGTGIAPWVIVALMAAALAWLAWEKWGPQDEGDIVASAMLAFER